MNTDNISVGDIFPTYIKMIKTLGLEKPKGGSNKTSQMNEIALYLKYEKTNKLNRQGKISNEIIITEIYDTPLERVETRGRKGEYAVQIKEFSKTLSSRTYLNVELMEIMGVIDDRNLLRTTNRNKQNRKINSYKFYLKKDFKDKVIGAMTSLQKQSNHSFSFEVTYKLKEMEKQPFKEWRTATTNEKQKIDNFHKDIVKEIEEKYNKSFNAIKFDKDAFEEFQERLDEILFEEMKIYAHCTIYKVQNNIGGYKINIPNENVLKELYTSKMRKRIIEYSFDRYYNTENSSKTFGGGTGLFGRRDSQIDDKIYYLRDEKVINFHNKLFEDTFTMNDIQMYLKNLEDITSEF